MRWIDKTDANEAGKAIVEERGGAYNFVQDQVWKKKIE
jgi:hypothetical protein